MARSPKTLAEMIEDGDSRKIGKLKFSQLLEKFMGLHDIYCALAVQAADDLDATIFEISNANTELNELRSMGPWRYDAYVILQLEKRIDRLNFSVGRLEKRLERHLRNSIATDFNKKRSTQWKNIQKAKKQLKETRQWIRSRQGAQASPRREYTQGMTSPT